MEIVERSHMTIRKSNGKIIDIDTSARKLGSKCNDLPVVHALTGSDNLSYPFDK